MMAGERREKWRKLRDMPVRSYRMASCLDTFLASICAEETMAARGGRRRGPDPCRQRLVAAGKYAESVNIHLTGVWNWAEVCPLA
jgi:hypothetical protein